MTAYLTIREVAERTTMSVRTIRRRASEKTFPSGVKLGPRTIRWPEQKVIDWLAAREGENP